MKCNKDCRYCKFFKDKNYTSGIIGKEVVQHYSKKVTKLGNKYNVDKNKIAIVDLYFREKAELVLAMLIQESFDFNKLESANIEVITEDKDLKEKLRCILEE